MGLGRGGAGPRYSRREFVNSKPKRPLMQRWPSVTVESIGDVTFTIWLSWTWRSTAQPTPQYGQMVEVVVCADSSHVPAPRMSNSVLNISAPVGQTPMQLPQYTHADSGSGTSHSVETRASKPRPAIANVFWASSPHASTHL